MRTLLWFRKGLRLHDNRALLEAVQGATAMHPVFVLDPHFAKPEFVGVNRYRFLLESLSDLNDSLSRLGSRLLVVQGRPREVLPRLLREWSIDKLCYESDNEPYAIVRDREIGEIAELAGVRVSASPGHTLHDLEEYVRLIGDQGPPKSYGSFLKVFNAVGRPELPKEAPATVPSLGEEAAGEAERYSVPTLESLGYDPTEGTAVFKGGESAALERLTSVMLQKAWVADFEKPKTIPTTLEPDTTALSPYMKFGCLSARKFWHAINEAYAAVGHSSKPPVSLHGQLLWREYNYTCATVTPNWDRMVGNPVCRQIPWDDNQEFFEAWRDGKTGYPFIDAIQTQLREEGWIHHLARHATACFLTRGDLWQSWEKGQLVFERYLVDADWSINAFNWMWLSCSAFFYQYFRCYSPVAFGKKYDPEGVYVKKYVPVLRNMPKKYIYEPWKAPLDVQRAAKCIIGKDYPEPIVDHAHALSTNKGRMAAAYKNQPAVPGTRADGPSGSVFGAPEDEELGKRVKVETGEEPLPRKRRAKRRET